MTVHGPQSTQRSDREGLVLERRLAAVFRALSEDAGVDLWAHRPADGNGLLPMNAPHLYPDPSRSDLTGLRGATDAMAMRRKWSEDRKSVGREREKEWSAEMGGKGEQ